MTPARRVLVAMNESDQGNFFPAGFGVWPGGVELQLIEEASLRSEEAWREALESCRPEVLLTGWSSRPLPEAYAEGDSALRYVCHLTGSVKHLVPRGFLERGGRVTNWGEIAGREVAEHALLLALAALRRMPHWRVLRRAPDDPPATSLLGTRTLFGRRVGIHGFGQVARALMALLAPFGVEIHVFSEGVPEAFIREHGARSCGSLQRLCGQSEVLFECEALTDRSLLSINQSSLACLPDGAVFVNVGRGGLVEEEALLREAESGRIVIALDVTQQEPLPESSPLARLPQAILSPHIAGPTYSSFPRCGEFAVENVRRYLGGEEPLLAEISLKAYDRAT